MYKSNYSNVNAILVWLLNQLKQTFGPKLVALYLEGSLVIGDFDSGISDIDLVAVVDYEINEKEFEALKLMHDTLVQQHKEWKDRIEACYITTSALKSIKTQNATIVNISPGEPIHRMESKNEWLMNWYLTREQSKTLFGPSPKSIIQEITKEEFIDAIKKHTKSWDIYIENMRNPYAQSYAILTLCRALYAVKNGKQTSKLKAALWVKKILPEWSSLIDQAIRWRKGDKYLPAEEKTFSQSKKFVLELRNLVLES